MFNKKPINLNLLLSLLKGCKTNDNKNPPPLVNSPPPARAGRMPRDSLRWVVCLSVCEPARLDERQQEEEDRQTVTVAASRPRGHRAPDERQSEQVASWGVGGGAVREAEGGGDGRQRHPEDVHQEETGSDQNAIHLEEEPSRKPRAAERRLLCE